MPDRADDDDVLDTLPPSLDPDTAHAVVDPPTSFVGTLRQLGPGLIIAGSIVGSGELIGTTKAGAQGGITLLWLILVGCVVKIFAQIELGRFSITHGETTLAALNSVPGPRVGRQNWILWAWWAMMLAGMLQMGGIVGGVGQSLALAMPITGDYIAEVQLPSEKELKDYVAWRQKIASNDEAFTSLGAREQLRIRQGIDRINAERQADDRLEAKLAQIQRTGKAPDAFTYDDRYWSAATAVVTSCLLYFGRYGLIQNLSTALVVAFTFVTLGNVFSLQTIPKWHISAEEFLHGLSFQLPSGPGLKTALATFGIIGVGATELVSYPYWCIEKGYAKHTGPRSDDPAWAARARGWMRVMVYDSSLSMVVYTTATIAFLLTGVAVLNREGRDPDGMRMVSTLTAAYVPVFGTYAGWLFLTGAFAVLYSTLLVACASHARTYTDALKLLGVIDRQNERSHRLSVTTISVVLPLLCLSVYWFGINPVTGVLISGVMQGILLPMLGGAALYFRFTKCDPRLRPSKLWDIMLCISCAALLVAGISTVVMQL